MKAILHGKWEDRIRNIPDNSVNLLIVDPPYKQTALDWDKKQFDYEKLFKEFNRISVGNGNMLVFGRDPILSYCRIAGIQYYKYDLIWKKSRKNNYVLAKFKPLSETEKISVFSKGGVSGTSKEKMAYYPQFLRKVSRGYKGRSRPSFFVSGCKEGNQINQTHADYPTDIIDINSNGYNELLHPCQKPIELFEYLILTYTRIYDNVVDVAFGSGNSLVAANSLNRNFIGIESNKEYYEFGRRSIASAKETCATPELQRAS